MSSHYMYMTLYAVVFHYHSDGQYIVMLPTHCKVKTVDQG